MVIEFAALGFTTLVAHNVADHVFGQNDYQAANKMKPGRSGWSALLQHVFAYHIIMAVMWLFTMLTFDLSVSLLGFITALLFSAVTHAILDRRWPVRWILEKTGSPEFAKMQTPLNGMYCADQALHELALWISVILLVIL